MVEKQIEERQETLIPKTKEEQKIPSLSNGYAYVEKIDREVTRRLQYIVGGNSGLQHPSTLYSLIKEGIFNAEKNAILYKRSLIKEILKRKDVSTNERQYLEYQLKNTSLPECDVVLFPNNSKERMLKYSSNGKTFTGPDTNLSTKGKLEIIEKPGMTEFKSTN